MLVLTRKLGESITIGNNIKITIIASNSSQVKLGIEAPVDISIYRTEIYQRIMVENQKAAADKTIDAAALRALWRQHVRKS